MLKKKVNEEYFDALIRHQTYLMRYSSEVRNKINTLLNATETDLAAKIRNDLAGTKGLSPRSLKKYKLLKAYIRNLRGKAWKDAEKMWLSEFTELVQDEAAGAAAMLSAVSPVVLETALPTVATLRGLVTNHPFEGRVLKSWARDIAVADVNRIESQILIGMIQGESSQRIARRIVGTTAKKGVDGITQLTRNNAQAITRTAINSLAGAARSEFYKENQDLYESELYVATLDNRTTLVCAGNDGKKFEIGKGPVPPLHFNCRSLRVPVIDGKVLGERPAKPFNEKQFVGEYNKANGLSAKNRATLPKGHKGSYDEYKRKRVRELTGQVPAKTSYQDWLTKQSNSFQDDTLGKTKAQLFRKGGLTLDKFTDQKGGELSLKQLASKHKEAFIDAGLEF